MFMMAEILNSAIFRTFYSSLRVHFEMGYSIIMLERITWKLTANTRFHSINLHAYTSHFEKATPVLKLGLFW